MGRSSVLHSFGEYIFVNKYNYSLPCFLKSSSNVAIIRSNIFRAKYPLTQLCIFIAAVRVSFGTFDFVETVEEEAFDGVDKDEEDGGGGTEITVDDDEDESWLLLDGGGGTDTGMVEELVVATVVTVEDE